MPLFFLGNILYSNIMYDGKDVSYVFHIFCKMISSSPLPLVILDFQDDIVCFEVAYAIKFRASLFVRLNYDYTDMFRYYLFSYICVLVCCVLINKAFRLLCVYMLCLDGNGNMLETLQYDFFFVVVKVAKEFYVKTQVILVALKLFRNIFIFKSRMNS